MKGDIFYRLNLTADKMIYKKEIIGLSFLDYFCNHLKEDVAFQALMTCRKQVLEKAVKNYKLVPNTNNCFSYFLIATLRTTHNIAEPLTIFLDAHDPKQTIFINYGCVVVKDKFIREYGLRGLEVIANATHTQPKQTRLERARLIWDYLHKIKWLE